MRIARMHLSVRFIKYGPYRKYGHTSRNLWGTVLSKKIKNPKLLIITKITTVKVTSENVKNL